jgi:uncharacterized repeat protein (TIGR01451 family)
MGSLLSAISDKFAKLIILGTMFPVVILSALNIFLVAPLLPQTASLPGYMARIAVGDEKWPAVMLSLVVFVLTGLLYNLNSSIIRIYEGYPWRNSLIGRTLLQRQNRRLSEALSLSRAVDPLRKQLNRANVAGPLLDDLQLQETALGVFLNSRIPQAKELLLPTSLGNAITCYRRYPFYAYGMDINTLWPRLVPKIDPAFSANIDEAKTTFDFMLNMSFLCILTTLGVLTIGLAAPAPLSWTVVLPWLWRASLFAMLAMIFYYFSVNRAVVWGQQINSAIDVYRLDLLKALGYQQKPLSYQEERALWFKISAELAYADDRVFPLPYEDPLTRVIPYPTDIKLQVRRHYETQQTNLRIPVVIELQNADPARPVTSLTVVDTLPDGYKYVPDSVAVSSEDIGLEVRRFAPPEFFLGPIPAGEAITISYDMKPANS